MKFIIFLLINIFILTGCKKNGHNKEVLNINLGRKVSTLDPANSYDTVSAKIVYNTYETLFEYHYLKRPYSLKPLLAEDMPDISKDGKVYTIKIKKNIRYHNSPAFNGQIRFLKAIDFVHQIKRLAFTPTRSNGWFLFDKKIVGLNEFRKNAGTDINKIKLLEVEGLKAIDDYTLQIKLTEKYPQILYALTMTFTSPVPWEAITYYKNNLSRDVVGTGPYILSEFNDQLNTKLKKFEHYREAFYPTSGDRYANQHGLLKDAGKKIPFIDEIVMHVIKEDSPRWLNFKSKKIDLLEIPKDNFNTAIQDNGDISDELKKQKIKLVISPTLVFYFLQFNMLDPVVGKNKNLRYAIAHGINVEKYIKLFTNNTGLRSYSLYPPGIPGYNPYNKLPIEHNVEKAKEYLKKAGYPNGKGLPVINYDARGDTTTSRQRAEYFKSELAKIGIRIKINLNNFPRFIQKEREGTMQMWLGGWAMDYPDSENILALLSTQNFTPGPNYSNFSHPEFDKKFEILAKLQSGPEKFKLMKEMENIVFEQLPWFMLFYDRKYDLFHSYVKNYRYLGISYNYLKYIRK